MGPYENCSVWGPYYKTKDGRRYVQITFPGGKTEGTNYARYLMEVKLGRILSVKEYVHHLDGNYLNDSIDNLEVVEAGQHTKLHLCLEVKESFVCPWCGLNFTLDSKKYSKVLWKKRNRPEQKGPFCCSRHANYFNHKRRKDSNWEGFICEKVHP